MDRTIVYPSALPADTDILQPQRDTATAVGFLTAAAIGPGRADGFGTVQVPGSMSVSVGNGSVTTYGVVDSNAFGSLPADSTPIVKTGIIRTSTILQTPAPTSNGQSINYLVQVAYAESDASPSVLQYDNAANPVQQYSGPGGAGGSQNTRRLQTVLVSAKAGASASTGSQVTPSPDSGYLGVFVVTATNGSSTLTIGPYNGGASMVGDKLPVTNQKLAALTASVAGIPAQVSANTTAISTNTSNISTLQTQVAANTSGLATANQKIAAIQSGVSHMANWAAAGSYTFTVPANVSILKVTVVGGGGGGGGGTTSNGGGGGGAGGTAWGYVPVSPGAQYTVTVGASGAGGNSGGDGVAGGSSSFSNLLSASGGSGGSGGANTLAGGVGGTGYLANSGVNSGVVLAGGYGGDGLSGSTAAGTGGTSSEGGGSRGNKASGFLGQGALGSGGGGGYGTSSPAGGAAGIVGIVSVEY
ncbi:glycine-rich domain-containing protein [Endobacter medicaginis]